MPTLNLRLPADAPEDSQNQATGSETLPAFLAPFGTANAFHFVGSSPTVVLPTGTTYLATGAANYIIVCPDHNLTGYIDTIAPSLLADLEDSDFTTYMPAEACQWRMNVIGARDQALDRNLTDPPTLHRQSTIVSHAAPSPAESLRRISGLDAARLAQIFGVSRTTYQQWVAGTTPRGTRYDDLLRVLSLHREAAEHLGGTAPLTVWLRTPVSPGGPTPADLLRQRRYPAFRGFLLRRPVEERLMRRRPLAPRIPRNLSSTQAQARRRIASGPWREEGEFDFAFGYDEEDARQAEDR